MQKLDAIDAASLRENIPAFRAGDTVKVHVKVVEGNRSRIQVFQGVVIARRGHGVSSTFTVRKVSFGVGVERTFPVHSPSIDHIEVVTHESVRRWYVNTDPSPADARTLVKLCDHVVTLQEILPDAFAGLTAQELGYQPEAATP